MANVIFDFDGTLADTFPLVVDVAYRLSPGTRRLSAKEIDGLRSLPLLTAMRRLGISKWHMPPLMLLTRRRLTPRMQEVPAYEGVLPMLHTLHDANHRLFILTSNYKENVQIFLKHHKVDHFFSDLKTVYYANVWIKAHALRRMIEQYELKADECYYVGNEALDMRAAERVGIRGVATTWGGFDYQKLREVKPFGIIDKPQDLAGLLQ